MFLGTLKPAFSEPSGLLLIHEVEAKRFPRFLHRRLLPLLDDDGLLRGAHRAVVKGLGAENAGHGLFHIRAVVDVGRAVARTHADGGLARGIGGLDHAGAAGSENQVNFR